MNEISLFLSECGKCLLEALNSFWLILCWGMLSGFTHIHHIFKERSHMHSLQIEVRVLVKSKK